MNRPEKNCRALTATGLTLRMTANLPVFRCGLWCSLCVSMLIAGCATPQNPVQADKAPPLAPSEPVAEQSAAPATPTAAPAQTTTAEERLWEKLARAEEETYAVLLRHAIAPGTGDPANFQLADCATQRNLSETGRQQAKAIGEAFRSRNIPVAEVLSSQWCRCLETADLIDIGPVTPFPALNSFFRARSAADAQTAQVREYITADRDRPGVIVMVTHQVNITALSGIFPPSGSAVVIQLNDGQPTVVGQLLTPSS